jgi:hypothetical protein
VAVGPDIVDYTLKEGPHAGRHAIQHFYYQRVAPGVETTVWYEESGALVHITWYLETQTVHRFAALPAWLDLFQLDGIPMFNEDDEQRPPSSVLELKKRIRRANALLIVTPEYNYSIPGVLKNAIEWACRPHGDSAWSGRAAAIMGASLSAIGTARRPIPSAADPCSSQLV